MNRQTQQPRRSSLRRRQSWLLARWFSVMVVVLVNIVGVGAGSALAADGPRNYYGPYQGYSYANYSQVDHYAGGGMYSETFALTTNGANAPTSYIGVQTSLYKNGALCVSNSMHYNSGPSNYESTLVVRNCGSGNYQARGSTAAYSGAGSTGYANFYTSITPIVTQ